MLVIMASLLFWFLSPITTKNRVQYPSALLLSQQQHVLHRYSNAKGQYQFDVELDNVSKEYLKLLINYEDKYFFEHYGINFSSLLRALKQWLSNGRVISGGSTITMQLVRIEQNIPRTVLGKLQQLFFALKYEFTLSKQQILQRYVNQIPFGGNYLGIEAASRFYFSVSAQQLTRAQAALLVALPQRPSAYRPDRYPELAIKMRNKVAQRAYQNHILSQLQLDAILEQPLELQPLKQQVYSEHIAAWLRQHTKSSIIRTTISEQVQYQLNLIADVYKPLLNYDNSIAIIVIENDTANILGYLGSIDFWNKEIDGQVDLVRAKRSPGSTLKPFIYALALEQQWIHSKSSLIDTIHSFDGYRPQNFNKKYQQLIQADEALIQSKNVAAVQLLNTIEITSLINLLNKAHIQISPEQQNLSLALGGAELSLWQLVQLYRSLARNGLYCPLTWKSRSSGCPNKPLLSPESAYITFQILSQQLGPSYRIPAYQRKIAWKSGTSSNQRDAWAIGVSGDYTVGVWTGRADGGSVHNQLGRISAGPILFDVFDSLAPDTYKIEKPNRVSQIQPCHKATATASNTCSDSQAGAYIIDSFIPKTLKVDGSIINSKQSLSHLNLANLLSQELVIKSPENLTHLFKHQQSTLKLKSNQKGIDWYIDGQLLSSNQITLNKLTNGDHLVEACNKLFCAKSSITIHP
ncbi:penicillin-binding protein 1C [Paraferrimonas sp. SM1919]|uniref:penicillin-binding protein 1C n=1 Tax=Paraferrimonas sp. SM1919 TaxID=2662263 RepID=UPI001F09C38F|nr:penicillin-binding protein 1C [Paraferrimonas sp. SM1919]